MIQIQKHRKNIHGETSLEIQKKGKGEMETSWQGWVLESEGFHEGELRSINGVGKNGEGG